MSNFVLQLVPEQWKKGLRRSLRAVAARQPRARDPRVKAKAVYYPLGGRKKVMPKAVRGLTKCLLKLCISYYYPLGGRKKVMPTRPDQMFAKVGRPRGPDQNC